MTRIIALISLAWLARAAQSADADVEHYARLPEYSSVTISPDGSHIGLVQRKDGRDHALVLRRSDNHVLLSVALGEQIADDVKFATDNHLLVYVRQNRRIYSEKSNWFDTLVIDLDTRETTVLLKHSKDTHHTLSRTRIVGVDSDSNDLYMGVYSEDIDLDLYKVDLSTGRGRRHFRGSEHTIDWFVGHEGEVLAREDYDWDRRQYRLLSRGSGNWKVIYTCECDRHDVSVQALSEDETELYLVKDNRSALHSISLATGEISPPLQTAVEWDVDGFFVDTNRKIQAFINLGLISEYEFVNEDLADAHARLVAAFPGAFLSYRAITDDKRFAIVLVSGLDSPDVFFLFDMQNAQAKRLVSRYPDVKQVGPLSAVRYRASDGLKIPAVLTWPPGKKNAKGLPLLVFPHFGVENHNLIGFDWWAQYFANRGYLVMQPNYRGSTGFGKDFKIAGRGKWGTEMQTDISDGVNAMVKAGYAAKDRVCVMGKGYPALASGAFTPEVFKCVIAVAGMSDLSKMRSKFWFRDFWEGSVPESKFSRSELMKISPIRYAGDFQAPVLLIHGEDDRVIPVEQSKNMANALAKADKPYELLIVEDADNAFFVDEQRIELLTAIDRFLSKHNPVDDVKITSTR